MHIQVVEDHSFTSEIGESAVIKGALEEASMMLCTQVMLKFRVVVKETQAPVALPGWKIIVIHFHMKVQPMSALEENKKDFTLFKVKSFTTSYLLLKLRPHLSLTSGQE